eukprot:TRINITY_DN7019_c0_g1_i1.p2 TRINITY_DN7019_c0_g1~~TRINITY_DN7019_c0_g1_i1.p2  ORF type:complete len:208 (-),score=4.47 TRINITY_DN7019_c0_g1_i1:27-650(-)
MRGSHIFAILYLTWMCIWGCPDTAMTHRGHEAENDTFIHALQSMGVRWRPISTEAPWGIGRNKRHHGPIRDAYLRITAETPALAPNLSLAMAYKARSDAPCALGSSPSAAVTGEAPRSSSATISTPTAPSPPATRPCRPPAAPCRRAPPPTASAAPYPTPIPTSRSSSTAKRSGSTAIATAGCAAHFTHSTARPSTWDATPTVIFTL